jgi:hypothetical protein
MEECVICGAPVMSDQEYCDDCKYIAALTGYPVENEAEYYGIGISY